MSDRPPGRPTRPGRGSIRPTTPAAPLMAACVGLIGGWSVRPLALYADHVVPRVTWLQVGVVAFVAVTLAGTAWITWRELQVHRQWLEAHRAVNRLMWAKSCVLVGALLAGGYAGSFVSWLGVAGEATAGNLVRCGCAALAGVAMVAAAIWLERACRVHDDEDADLA
ncbi:DUF3180 domain-containing protein [Nocardioides jiangxiensis]|uniref:DUF3180 domain-containing protein n=1 Tax=Nocardioides jiangxiensis TaxID=3064524 RepID=A0ABT9B121_9ACTN|nr:DUF3180 domain-containing protein [Nocardioides sp. WY-20]MDO7868551.1 DUF3180 domain-containing protein [Nocardioides sp. WY-20]